MKMEMWDKIGPRLHELEFSAQLMANNAKAIQLSVQGLPARPAWETLAREELNKAEQALRIALAVVQGAQSIYDRLPVTVEFNQEAAE